MEAAEAKVQKVLQGDKQFLVPHFQRPYSWRKQEWRALSPLTSTKLEIGSGTLPSAFPPNLTGRHEVSLWVRRYGRGHGR